MCHIFANFTDIFPPFLPFFPFFQIHERQRSIYPLNMAHRATVSMSCFVCMAITVSILTSYCLTLLDIINTFSLGKKLKRLFDNNMKGILFKVIILISEMIFFCVKLTRLLCLCNENIDLLNCDHKTVEKKT